MLCVQQEINTLLYTAYINVLTSRKFADVPCSIVLALYLMLTFACHLPVCVTAAVAVRHRRCRDA